MIFKPILKNIGASALVSLLIVCGADAANASKKVHGSARNRLKMEMAKKKEIQQRYSQAKKGFLEGGSEQARISAGRIEPHGMASFMLAIQKDDHEFVRSVCRADRDRVKINADVGGGWTPVLCAAHHGSCLSLKVLKEFGADFSATLPCSDGPGMNAIAVALRKERLEAAELLNSMEEEKGAINAKKNQAIVNGMVRRINESDRQAAEKKAKDQALRDAVNAERNRRKAAEKQAQQEADKLRAQCEKSIDAAIAAASGMLQREANERVAAERAIQQAITADIDAVIAKASGMLQLEANERVAAKKRAMQQAIMADVDATVRAASVPVIPAENVVEDSVVPVEVVVEQPAVFDQNDGQAVAQSSSGQEKDDVWTALERMDWVKVTAHLREGPSLMECPSGKYKGLSIHGVFDQMEAEGLLLPHQKKWRKALTSATVVRAKKDQIIARRQQQDIVIANKVAAKRKRINDRKKDIADQTRRLALQERRLDEFVKSKQSQMEAKNQLENAAFNHAVAQFLGVRAPANQ